MVTVFWDSKSVIFIDYLEKGQTVTGLDYPRLLGHIDTELLNKASFGEKKEMKIFFHHDNALAHISVFATVILAELGYELLKAIVRTSHWERVSEILSSTD